MTFKFSLCNEVFRIPISEALERIASLGFDGVEIAPFTLAPSVEEIPPWERLRIRKAAEDLGLEIVGLHWLLVSPPGLHISTPDAAIRSRTADYLASLARFAGDLGGGVLVLGSPGQRNLEPGEDVRAAMERAAQTLREAAQAAGDSGVRLLIEPLHPKETNFINTVEEALELLRMIDHPAAGFILDCKAMSGMPEGIEGTLRRYGSAAAHFHANTPGGKAPGMDETDFVPILRALRESGYRGWVSVEPFDYEPDPETVARTALETLKAAGRTA